MKQDKIVIFNEVIDVMRAILFLGREKQKKQEMKKALEKQRRQERKDELNLARQRSAHNPSERKKIEEEILNDDNEEEVAPYIIFKEIIVEAWIKFRPKTLENSPRFNEDRRVDNEEHVERILGKNLVERILDNFAYREIEHAEEQS